MDYMSKRRAYKDIPCSTSLSVFIDRWIASPLDYERMNPALVEGDIGHIALFLNQSFGNRPLPGWGQYKTPIQGLYMCGASTHPGVDITGEVVEQPPGSSWRNWGLILRKQ